jgi:hypothetical protein
LFEAQVRHKNFTTDCVEISQQNRVEISRIEIITEREKYKRIISKTAVFRFLVFLTGHLLDSPRQAYAYTLSNITGTRGPKPKQ